jgi:hypothetical protein
MLNTLPKHHFMKDLSSSLPDEAVCPVSIGIEGGGDSERTIRPSPYVGHVEQALKDFLVFVL